LRVFRFCGAPSAATDKENTVFEIAKKTFQWGGNTVTIETG